MSEFVETENATSPAAAEDVTSPAAWIIENGTTFLNDVFSRSSDAIRTIVNIAAPEEEVSKKTILLIIDPQNDFHEGGSLPVTGALADSERTANMIKANGSQIDEIYVTLDSHHRNAIFHSIFWVDAEGQHPQPFTTITFEDVEANKWTPRKAANRPHALQYTKFLKDEGKFQLLIWPDHCLIGTCGHNVVKSLNDALQEWVEQYDKEIKYVMKGENTLTEMYSAIKAEFPIPSDPRTFRDPALKRQLDRNKIIVCGQALSHCVNFTFTDIMSEWPQESLQDLILLTDATSAVGGFDQAGQDFIASIKAKGCQTSTTAEVFTPASFSRDE